jgi:hypothetical protein
MLCLKQQLLDTTGNVRSNPVGEGFPNRVSEFLLGKNHWRFK